MTCDDVAFSGSVRNCLKLTYSVSNSLGGTNIARDPRMRIPLCGGMNLPWTQPSIAESRPLLAVGAQVSRSGFYLCSSACRCSSVRGRA